MHAATADVGERPHFTKSLAQYCSPEKFSKNEVAGSSQLLHNLAHAVSHQPDALRDILAEASFLEKLSADWEKLFHKFKDDKLYSKLESLHFHSIISLVVTFCETNIAEVGRKTDWESRIYHHISFIPLKKHYLASYLGLVRMFLCHRFAARSHDYDTDRKLLLSVAECTNNQSLRVSSFAAFTMLTFPTEIQMSEDLSYEFNHLLNSGKDIVARITADLNTGSSLQEREIFWIEEVINIYNFCHSYSTREKLFRMIGDYLVNTGFLALVSSILERILTRSKDGNVLKLLSGTLKVPQILEILWRMDDSQVYSNYFHHLRIAEYLVGLLQLLFSSGILRNDYEVEIRRILRSIWRNCLEFTELKQEYYNAGTIGVFEKAQSAILKNSDVQFITLSIICWTANEAEIAEFLDQNTTTACLSKTLHSLDSEKRSIDVKHFGEIRLVDVLTVLISYERDSARILVAQSDIPKTLVHLTEDDNISKDDLRLISEVLLSLSLNERTNDALINSGVLDMARKLKHETSESTTVNCLNGLIWQLNDRFDLTETEPPEVTMENINVFICAASQDSKFLKRFEDILSLKGFKVISEKLMREKLKSIQAGHVSEDDPGVKGPWWARGISESHLVVVVLSENLERDSAARLKLQLAKQMEMDVRFVDTSDYRPKNWVFDMMQRCPLYDNVNQIMIENVYRSLTELPDTQLNPGEVPRKQHQRRKPEPITPRGGIVVLSQWDAEEVSQWLASINLPRAVEAFSGFTGEDLSRLKERCAAESATEFGRYLREEYALDLYTQKKLRDALPSL